jgi:hypothetical protein
MRKWWLVNVRLPPTFVTTDPPKSIAFLRGSRTNVHTSRSLRGGTSNRGILSVKAEASGARTSVASAAATHVA